MKQGRASKMDCNAKLPNDGVLAGPLGLTLVDLSELLHVGGLPRPHLEAEEPSNVDESRSNGPLVVSLRATAW